MCIYTIFILSIKSSIQNNICTYLQTTIGKIFIIYLFIHYIYFGQFSEISMMPLDTFLHE